MRIVPAAALAVAFLVAACGGDDGADPVVRGPAAPEIRPAPPPAGTDPPAVIEDDPASRLARGEELYVRFCAGCHGVDGKGNGHNVRQLGQAPLRDLSAGSSVSALGTAAVLEAIRSGKGAPGDPPHALMPPYRLTLDPEEERAIVDYLGGLPARSFPPEVNLSSTNEPRCQPCHASAGRTLLAELNCAGCHELAGFERREIGPDLSAAGSRFRKPWLYAFVGSPYNRHPLGYRPLESNRMPDFDLDVDRRRALAEFLARQVSANPLPPAPDLSDPMLASMGEKMFRIEGCIACHRVDVYGGRFGPDLSGAGLQFRPEWLVAWLEDPASLRPETPMPTPVLEPESRRAIASYLLSARSKFPGIVNPVRLDRMDPDADRPAVVAELQGIDDYPEPSGQAEADSLAAEGRRLYQALGCHACHRLDGIDPAAAGPVGPELTPAGLRLEAGWLYDFLGEAVDVRPRLEARMPRLVLTVSERQSLVYTLQELAAAARPDLARRISESTAAAAVVADPAADPTADPTADRAAGRQAFLSRDCHSCHVMTGEDFPPAAHPYFDGAEQAERQRWAPDLSLARRRLVPAAIHLQLDDPRNVWSQPRMPKIGLPPDEIHAIAAFLRGRD